MLSDKVNLVGCVDIQIKERVDVPLDASPFKGYSSEKLALHFLKQAKDIDGSYEKAGVEDAIRVLCGSQVKVIKKVWEDNSFSWEVCVMAENENYTKFHEKMELILPVK